MKLLLIISAILTISISGLSSMKSFFDNSSQDDTSACITKVKSGWGNIFEDCPADYVDSYFVKMENQCDQKIDVKCCVQQKFKSWKCKEKLGMEKGDTITVHACKSNGKFLHWTKIHGDTELIFPTDEEIDNEYKE